MDRPAAANSTRPLNRLATHALAPARVSPLTANATKKTPMIVPTVLGRPGLIVVAPRKTAASAGNR